MTTQDKINYKNPVAQNLFLLTQNSGFKKDIEELKEKHKNELGSIARLKMSTTIINEEGGSDSLQKDIDAIAKSSPLYNRPQRHILRCLIVYLLTKVSIKPLLRDADINTEINTIKFRPWVDIDVDEVGVVIQASCSLYHTKTEVLDLISKSWDKVEQKKKELTKTTKLAQDKLQPFIDFEKDWQIYLDKQSYTYEEIVDKYDLNDFSSASMIVTRIKNRIKALYSR
jgi:hypothetical protein